MWHNVSSNVLLTRVVVTMNPNKSEDRLSFRVDQDDGSGRTQSTAEMHLCQRACRFAAEIRYIASETFGLFVGT